MSGLPAWVPGVNGLQCERCQWGSEEAFTFLTFLSAQLIIFFYFLSHSPMLLSNAFILDIWYCWRIFSFLVPTAQSFSYFSWCFCFNIPIFNFSWKLCKFCCNIFVFFWHFYWKPFCRNIPVSEIIFFGPHFYGNLSRFLPQYSCFWNAPLSATKWLMGKVWPNPQYLHQKTNKNRQKIWECKKLIKIDNNIGMSKTSKLKKNKKMQKNIWMPKTKLKRILIYKAFSTKI